MTDDLRTKLYDAQKALFSALTSYSIGSEHDNWDLVREGQDETLNNMQNRVDAVEQSIRRGCIRKTHTEPKSALTRGLAQQMANHESARRTGLYHRRGDDVSLDEVERITI